MPSRLSAFSQTDWAIEDEVKNLNLIARPYYKWAFSLLDTTAVLVRPWLKEFYICCSEIESVVYICVALIHDDELYFWLHWWKLWHFNYVYIYMCVYIYKRRLMLDIHLSEKITCRYFGFAGTHQCDILSLLFVKLWENHNILLEKYLLWAICFNNSIKPIIMVTINYMGKQDFQSQVPWKLPTLLFLIICWLKV